MNISPLMKRLRALGTPLVLSGLILCLAGCGHRISTYEETQSHMGTYVTITVDAGSEEQARAAMNAGFAEIKRLEQILSLWRNDSELSKVNATAHEKPVPVSPEIYVLADQALGIARLSDGAFDPTVGPLVRLWNVKERKAPPMQAEIDEAKTFVDYRKVSADAGAVRFLEKGISIDFGGIAKGYTADRVVEILKSKGIKSGIVAVAGDIKAFGGKVHGKPWQVGIQDPRGKGLLASVAMDDGCISTSGDYERYFEFGGQRYHHIVNPATGYPAEGLWSLSILHTEGIMCDGLSTAMFVLGPEKARKKMEENNLSGVMVEAGGGVYASPAAAKTQKITIRP